MLTLPGRLNPSPVLVVKIIRWFDTVFDLESHKQTPNSYAQEPMFS